MLCAFNCKSLKGDLMNCNRILVFTFFFLCKKKTLVTWFKIQIFVNKDNQIR